MILAGDIGGTKTRLALLHAAPGPRGFKQVAEATFASRDHQSLEEIVDAFFEARSVEIDRACFGIAGPVRNGRVETTNLSWIVDAESLRAHIGGAPVQLINDLEANAWGIGALLPDELVDLNPSGHAAAGTAAILSAGTGLGEAGLFWDGSTHRPFASEGGHSDLAPRNELEDALLSWLRGQFGGHVSYERVLSGPGLYNVYRFLRETGRGEEPAWLRDAFRTGDPAALISGHAQDGSSTLCGTALELFVSIYGAEAGNVALKFLSTGGLYIGGGIAPKILPRLEAGGFLRSYLDKGRLRPVLEAIPVRVIRTADTALLGAARAALHSG